MGCASSTPAVTTPSQALPAAKDFFDSYALGGKLGHGTFGQVHIVTQLTSKKGSKSKEEFAVKILDRRDEQHASEVYFWFQVRNHIHRNVARLQDAFYDEDFVYFVMEKYTSSLFAHLESIAELNERSIGNILRQMLLGIEHVHSVGVVHRDVKPDSFLVGGTDGATVKLCCFGLSAALPREGTKKGLLKGVYGTAPFMCPEMIEGKHYDERADVWSLGILAYVLLFGTFPYMSKVATSKAMKQAIVDGKPPTWRPVAPHMGQKGSKNAGEFVKKLLERSIDQRPFASGALRMRYMLAVLHNEHMNFAELPSLRPMIYTAKEAGAFEFCDLTKKAEIDHLLNIKQQEKHGMHLLGRTMENNFLGKTSGVQSKETTKSADWQIANTDVSLKSKVWDNTSTLATTASANSSSRRTIVPSDCSLPRLMATHNQSIHDLLSAAINPRPLR